MSDREMQDLIVRHDKQLSEIHVAVCGSLDGAVPGIHRELAVLRGDLNNHLALCEAALTAVRAARPPGTNPGVYHRVGTALVTSVLVLVAWTTLPRLLHWLAELIKVSPPPAV